MTATSHAVIGTIIAAKIGNPTLAIPLAFLSHIAADALPHWDVGTNGHRKKKKSLKAEFFEALLDVAAGFILSYLLIYFFFPQTDLKYAFLLIIVSQSLDWATAPFYFFDIKFPPFQWIYKFQKMFDNRLDKPWGIINQIAILTLVLALAKIF